MVEVNSSQYYKLALQYSSLAFLYYDYALTFGKEVQYIWSKPFRIPVIMYFFCRYAMLANVLYLLAFTGILHDCNMWYQIVSAISILGRIGIMTLMTIRTYVVWGRKPVVIIFFGALELGCVILSAIKVPTSICRGVTSGRGLQVSATLSVMVLVFDILVTLLTLVRAHLALRRWRRDGVGYKNTMMYFIWEQGIIYFLAVFGLQLAAIVVPTVAPGGFFQRMFAAFTLPLSGLLSARFLLYLQGWSDEQQKQMEGSSVFSSCNLDFVSTPEQRARKDFVDEFGTDPVGWSPVRRPGRTSEDVETDVEDDRQ